MLDEVTQKTEDIIDGVEENTAALLGEEMVHDTVEKAEDMIQTVPSQDSNLSNEESKA